MSKKIKLKKVKHTSKPKLKSNLNPCPFCGNDEFRVIECMSYGKETSVGWFVVCEPASKPCGTQGPIKQSMLGAKRAWNKRKKTL